MNYLRCALGPILVTLILPACGGSQPTDSDAKQSQAPESVFDPMVTTVDKAKTVEDLSAGRTEDLDKKIEKSQ